MPGVGLSAGHMPIILVRSGPAKQLDQPQGLLLGASGDAQYSDAMAPLEPGDAVLLFTDGLVEQRDTPIDDSLEALMAIAGRPIADIDAFADLLAAEATSDTSDDACLLAVSLR